MKIISKVLLSLLSLGLLYSCTGPVGPVGPQGPPGLNGLDGSYIHDPIIIDVPQDSWKYTNAPNNNYFYATVSMPEITEDVFDFGIIKMYRVFDYDKPTAMQQEMPFIRLKEYQQGAQWFSYTESVDYDITIGGITIYYTLSDFDYEIDQTFIPEPMQFRCMIMY